MKSGLTKADGLGVMMALATGEKSFLPDVMKPGGIERQEAAGQQSFVNSSTLPRLITGGHRATLEKMGVTFGDDADDIFVNVALPVGWSKRATDHSMHSDLLDDKGRIRATIFYKAAYYDRRADMQLVTRYKFNCYQPCDEQGILLDDYNAPFLATVITNGGEPIQTIGFCRAGDYEAGDKLEEQAKAWLNEHFPEWRNVLSYWD